MRRSLVLLAASMVVAASALAVPAASADQGVEQDCQNISTQDTTHYATTRPSLPLQEMGVDEAMARLRKEHVRPGAGVTVAVVDSGVADGAHVQIAGQRVDAGNKVQQPSDYHGTAMAGLIAGAPRARADGGPVGIAPGARIFDVQVYDEADASTAADSDLSPMTVENLREGLDAVIQAAPTLGIRIVNMSLAIPDDDRIRAQIEQLWGMGIVVVAPTGNRSERPPGLPASFAEHSSGEDAAPYIHPADYDHVLGVNATPEGSSNDDPMHWVLESSATDVAAPTAMGVSYSLRGESCLLVDPATSYAAAEVSGVLALLQSAYPGDSVAASVQRLLTTANGPTGVPDTLVGAGEVQAMDALTRPMVIAADGSDLGAGSVEHEPQVLSVPKEPKDVLASTRKDAVWWGLGGGGVLLLALVLRPVLARRRRTLSR